MSSDYPHPIIAREGWPFIAIGVVLALALSYLGFWIFAVVAWLAVVFVVQFFRDPPRAVPAQPNAVLSPAQMSLLSVDQQSLITASRQSSALLQSLVQQSLANASGRFADVLRLSAAIGSTTDQKSVLELQATMGAEQSLLLGEQTKLQILNRAVQAQQSTTRERERELVIAGEGSFAARFRPSLP